MFVLLPYVKTILKAVQNGCVWLVCSLQFAAPSGHKLLDGRNIWGELQTDTWSNHMQNLVWINYLNFDLITWYRSNVISSPVGSLSSAFLRWRLRWLYERCDHSPALKLSYNTRRVSVRYIIGGKRRKNKSAQVFTLLDCKAHHLLSQTLHYTKVWLSWGMLSSSPVPIIATLFLLL